MAGVYRADGGMRGGATRDVTCITATLPGEE